MKLWIAQGFGVGRIPFAPGTFGSLLGVLWMWALLLTNSWWWYSAGAALGLGLSVHLCGEAAKILNDKDPASVVLDEIAAMPVGFIGALATIKTGEYGWPGRMSGIFYHPQEMLILSALTFIFFRIFDILKPWPIFQSQKLKGGLGITIDDFLAGIYTALVVAALKEAYLHWWSR